MNENFLTNEWNSLKYCMKSQNFNENLIKIISGFLKMSEIVLKIIAQNFLKSCARYLENWVKFYLQELSEILQKICVKFSLELCEISFKITWNFPKNRKKFLKKLRNVSFFNWVEILSKNFMKVCYKLWEILLNISWDFL